MQSVIQNLEVKIYIVEKFKRHKIKNHSNMLRIAYDPKHVGVIFNFVSFKLLYNVYFNLWVLYNWVDLVG